MSTVKMDKQSLAEQVEKMRPWHHDIEINEEFSTGEVFSPTKILIPAENEGVSLISPRERFLKRLDSLYPDSLAGKRYLDCACNAGAYCFMARERGAEKVVGFDVRDHWINQAKFVQEQRTLAPTDRIEFHTLDLYDLPTRDFGKFDLTYFSGIFYHLPDPVTGLKIAADLTEDIIVVNTAMRRDENNPSGMTMAIESDTQVMSGVHQMSWYPNGPECIHNILSWMGFAEMKLTMDITREGYTNQRIELIAAREEGRLANLDGEYFTRRRAQKKAA